MANSKDVVVTGVSVGIGWGTTKVGLCFDGALIEPVPGRLLVMNGQRSLHSVTAMRDGADRVNVVMSFDDDEVAARPGHELDT